MKKSVKVFNICSALGRIFISFRRKDDLFGV